MKSLCAKSPKIQISSSSYIPFTSLLHIDDVIMQLRNIFYLHDSCLHTSKLSRLCQKSSLKKSGKYYGFRLCCMRLKLPTQNFWGYPSFGATLFWGYQYKVTLIVFRVPLKFLCVYCKDYF